MNYPDLSSLGVPPRIDRFLVQYALILCQSTFQKTISCSIYFEEQMIEVKMKKGLNHDIVVTYQPVNFFLSFQTQTFIDKTKLNKQLEIKMRIYKISFKTFFSFSFR